MYELTKYQESLDNLIAPIKKLELIANLSRTLVWGDEESKRIFGTTIDDLLKLHFHRQTESIDRSSGNNIHHKNSNNEMNDHSNYVTHNNRKKETEHLFNLAPMIDILIGLSYETECDPKKIQQIMQSVQLIVSHVLPRLETLYINFRESIEHSENSLKAAHLLDLSLLDSNENKTPAVKQYENDLDSLIDKWCNDNPITRWVSKTQESKNNICIDKVTPKEIINPEAVITIHAGKQMFEDIQPSNVAIFIGSNITPLSVMKWDHEKLLQSFQIL